LSGFLFKLIEWRKIDEFSKWMPAEQAAELRSLFDSLILNTSKLSWSQSKTRQLARDHDHAGESAKTRELMKLADQWMRMHADFIDPGSALAV